MTASIKIQYQCCKKKNKNKYSGKEQSQWKEEISFKLADFTHKAVLFQQMQKVQLIWADTEQIDVQHLASDISILLCTNHQLDLLSS